MDLTKPLSKSPVDHEVEDVASGSHSQQPILGFNHEHQQIYRLYKRRFAGTIGFFILNVAAAMAWPWFGPISNKMVDEFGITLDQVNWLGIIISCVYLPTAILIPVVCDRWGIRRCCDIGVIFLFLAAWIRFCGTTRSLSTNGAYALLIVGQFFASIAQPIFQVLGPAYSEAWFDLKGRTTATMVIAISNPIGGALGQLISPLVGTTRQSILILGIISTAAIPFVLLIGSAPPTPPTYSGSKKSPSLLALLRAWVGRKGSPDAFMTMRERVDFTLVALIFGVLVAATNTFAILTAEILEPSGYSADTAGFMGATLLLAGIVAAVATAPLFDRVFTHHLSITIKIFVPSVAITWLSLIWAVKPRNALGLYVIMALIGICSITMLPVGLELACELTRSADASSAVLWFAGNLFGVIFILVEGALRASPSANPPLNMRKALIFNGVFILITSSSVFLIRGKQARKELDEEKNQAQVVLHENPRAEHLRGM